jgi:hypothetical protein
VRTHVSEDESAAWAHDRVTKIEHGEIG